MPNLNDLFKKLSSKLDWIVIVLALIAGIHAYYPSFINPYIIADDVRITNYWMRMFQDPALFQNDLLSEYASGYSPWGYNFLFYIFSFILDPIFFGNVLALALLVVAAYYMFKLVESFAGQFGGLLAALCVVMSQTIVSRMAGGTPRVFADPLIIVSLYYLVKKDYWKVSIVLILECLFYPMVFLISMLTFAFSFLRFDQGMKIIDTSKSKWLSFGLAIVICGGILIGKHILSYNPKVGSTYSKKELVNNPESYLHGRTRALLPIAPMFEELESNFKSGTIILKTLLKSIEFVPGGSLLLRSRILVILFILILLIEIFRKKIKVPIEILYLFLSSILMYQVAAAVFLKLYWPYRYLNYSIPIISLIVFVVVVSQVVGKIKREQIRAIAQIIIILSLLLSVRVYKNLFFIDVTKNKEWLEYLSTTPKDTVFAAHPKLADDIPTFSKRIVYLNYEMSHTWYDKYWPTIKKRTYQFFNAYYSDNPLVIYKFCKENNIDYFVINAVHFRPEFLRYKLFYFEPFNTFIVQTISKRRRFVFADIPKSEKVFEKDGIFVLHRDSLLRIAAVYKNQGLLK